MTAETQSQPARPPLPIAVLAGAQFAAIGAAVVVVLGEKAVDSELSIADVVPAVIVALVGAALVGATWSGFRPAWFAEQPLAVAAAAWCAFGAVRGSSLWWVLAAGSVVWLAVLWLPAARRWFNRQA
ncbi:MAG: hypothetical protein ACRD0G_16480 [Acidimicrobiales bacterium]